MDKAAQATLSAAADRSRTFPPPLRVLAVFCGVRCKLQRLHRVICHVQNVLQSQSVASELHDKASFHNG